MRTIPQTRPGEVLVQCVWPAARGPKPDCRSDSGVIWAGHGDVKAYPADRWPLLAEHPDVWRLFDPATMSLAGTAGAVSAQADAQPDQPTQLERDQADVLQQAMERIRYLEALVAKHLVKQVEPTSPLVPNDLEERQQQAASRNTDLVAVVLDDGAPDDSGAAVGDQADTETVAAHETLKAPALMLTIDDLKAMSVEEVRQLATARAYMLNPRLKAEKLYEQFLEMQAMRAEKKA